MGHRGDGRGELDSGRGAASGAGVIAENACGHITQRG